MKSQEKRENVLKRGLAGLCDNNWKEKSETPEI